MFDKMEVQTPVNNCYACEVSFPICNNCPINWDGGSKKRGRETFCYTDTSPFRKWAVACDYFDTRNEDDNYAEERKKWAKEMIKLIQTTWKDDHGK